MRVYHKGVQIPVDTITWDIMMDLDTKVDYTKDTHIMWPDHIINSRVEKMREVLLNLGYGPIDENP